MTKEEKIKLFCEMSVKIYLQNIEEKRGLDNYKTEGYDPDEVAFDSVEDAGRLLKYVLEEVEELPKE